MTRKVLGFLSVAAFAGTLSLTLATGCGFGSTEPRFTEPDTMDSPDNTTWLHLETGMELARAPGLLVEAGSG